MNERIPQISSAILADMSPTLRLAIELIKQRSISPNDGGCQEILIQHLEALDFRTERLPFGDVTNLWGRHGVTDPVLVFAGHTDVVPPGPEELWHSPPFAPTVREGCLYGRGASDMKGAIAAFTSAAERFVSAHPKHKGSLCLLVTSDEEAVRINGTKRVIEHLRSQGQHIDWCIVGEPSSKDLLGDEIKNGHRGSLSGKLIVKGIQGHVGYPHLALNPIHTAAPALSELVSTIWDQGNAFFPPTSLQITDIHGGVGAGNVIPAQLAVHFNFRFCTEVTEDQLKQRVEEILDRHALQYEISWVLDIEPFLSPAGHLVEVTRKAIRSICGRETKLSTAGGTSDGRFIAPAGAQIVELGTRTATMHKPNECVAVEDLENLSLIYEEIISQLLL